MEKQDLSVHLLALASLFEEEFSIDWLAEMTHEKPSRIMGVIEKGLKNNLLTKKTPGVFSFADPAQKKSFRDSYTRQEEEYWHCQIAHFLSDEALKEQDLLSELAHHLTYFPKGYKRAQVFLKAGDMELSGFNTEKALRYYKKVFDDILNDHTEEEDELFIKTAIKYSKLSMAQDDTHRIAALLQNAMGRAEKRNFKNELILLKMHLAKNEWLSGLPDQAFHLFEESWTQALAVDNPELLRAASAFRIFFFYWQGRYKEAVTCYEQLVPDVAKFPFGGFSLMATIMAGYCYALSGQTTHGLGMMDAIRHHYRSKGDTYLALYAETAIASVMMSMGFLKESLDLYEKALREVDSKNISWLSYIIKFSLASGYLRIGDREKGQALIENSISHSRQFNVSTSCQPILIEFCWAAEIGRLPKSKGLDIEQEINKLLESSNLHCQGVAHRYKAFLQEKRGFPVQKVIQQLKHSLQLLEQSGHQFEMGRTLVELTRRYLKKDIKKAEETAQKAYTALSAFNKKRFPEDLKHLIQVDRQTREKLLEEILRLSQETTTIMNYKELVHHIISTVNRVIKAERGAIFMLDEKGKKPRIQIKASRNLTQEEISSPGFGPSMKMIETVARTSRASIKNEILNGRDSSQEQTVSSRICVPLIIRGRVTGVLYHENRLLPNTFGVSDLEFLFYFASQVAVALDNSQAYQEVRIESEKLREEKQYYEEEHKKTLHFDDFIGKSPAIEKVFTQVNQVASTETTVVITGETGVGKELVASIIHRNSLRNSKPFIRVHCGALPENLITSELFGHEKGAFTGAVSRRIGRFELANGGTLFLDEIGDLSLDIQIRLLRVLQTKEFERVGGSKTIHSDFRLIAATNRDLEAMVQKGQFRADLYYRLNVFPIRVPPLRKRKGDIPLLANHFLKIHTKKMGKNIKSVSSKVIDQLCQYDWPGNVRELENIIERGVIHSSGPIFRLPDLGIVLFPQQRESERELSTLEEAERHHIKKALKKSGWRVRGLGGAAELLNIKPTTLEFRMRKLGLTRPSGVVIKRNRYYYSDQKG